MDAHVRDCLVANYEPLIAGLNLPDPDDRHVLAAAIHARAHVIVTYNLSDFPAAVLRPYALEAQHPDEFIYHLTDLAPEAGTLSAQRCRARLKNPPKTTKEYLAILEGRQLPQTVAFLRQMGGLI